MAKLRSLFLGFMSRKGLPVYEAVMLFIICTMTYVAWAGGVFHSGERSGRDLNRHRMLVVNMSLQAYHWANSSWPPDLGTLACEGRGRSTCVPHASPAVLRDPWGAPYKYEFSENGFIITSLGADGKEGGAGLDADVEEEGP